MSSALYPAARRERAGTRRGALIEFDLPSRLEATRPAEERGRGRDDVRLLVARRGGQDIEHRSFTDLPRLLERGDVLIVNTSATLPASLEAQTVAGEPAELHLSTRDPDGATDDPDRRWVVELRHAPSGGPRPARAQRARRGSTRPRARWCDSPRAERHGCWRPPRVPRPRGWRPGCGSPISACRGRCPPTSPGTAVRSATATPTTTGRSTPTRRSSPRRRAAPRWRARPGPSARSS